MVILFLSIEFNFCCGISRSIFSLTQQLKLRGHEVILGSPGGTMVKDFIEKGMDFVFLPIFPEKKNIKDAWSCISKIKDLVKRYKVDVIHSHHRLAELFSLTTAFFRSTPTVTTAHAIISGKRSLSFRSDKVIAVSDVIKDMLINYFNVQEKSIQVIRNVPRTLFVPSGVQKDAFKKSFQVSDDDFVVAGIGRLHQEKGFDIFLKAIKNLQQFKKIKVILVGKGSEIFFLKEYSKQHNLDVTFIDEIDEVELIYSIADIIIVPSRLESAGLVPIEAAYFSRPVIASNVGGLKETIEDNVTGILVPPEDDIALSRAIKKLYEHRDVAEKLGTQLFKYVTKEYNVNNIVSQIESLYRQLILTHRKNSHD